MVTFIPYVGNYPSFGSVPPFHLIGLQFPAFGSVDQDCSWSSLMSIHGQGSTWGHAGPLRDRGRV